jgi:2-iminobutanoate/2-iminopropanoate deaminase
MNAHTVSRRGFAARFAALASGVGLARIFSSAPASAEGAAQPQEMGNVKKLDYEAKPSSPDSFITPLVIHNGVLYIAGQGAHSHNEGDFPKDIETHTTKVMESVKALVEAGGGSMDSILMLTVYLANIDFYDGMNKVFKTYFPHGGPARTTVAVAALPGDSLVEINCVAAITKK